MTHLLLIIVLLTSAGHSGHVPHAWNPRPAAALAADVCDRPLTGSRLFNPCVKLDATEVHGQ